VLLNVDPSAIVRRLVESGFELALAIEQVEEALAHPYIASASEQLAKRNTKPAWFLGTLASLAREASRWGQIERRSEISSEEFFDRYYATNTPLVIEKRLAGWPAVERWTLAYLVERFGNRVVEVQANRTADPTYEMNSDHHKKTMPFREYAALIGNGPNNDYYMTANNFSHNQKALAELYEELGTLDELLEPPGPTQPLGMLWLGPAGTVTQLHHDLTNNLMAQVVGRKMVKLISPLDTPKLYNFKHVYSRITDVDDPNIDYGAYPLFKDATIFPALLEPGDLLFIPIGWWHHVRSLDVSITLTCTNFRRRNDYYKDFPRD
jgi:ribosomal protein L16 Arg81 hydroxylase